MAKADLVAVVDVPTINDGVSVMTFRTLDPCWGMIPDMGRSCLKSPKGS